MGRRLGRSALLAALAALQLQHAHAITRCNDALCAQCRDLLGLACLTCVEGYALNADGDCLDASTPAGNQPSFILFSVDGSMIPERFAPAYDEVIAKLQQRNPNGCRPPLTWFASKQGRNETDCEVVMQAYNLGHEIANHGISHSDGFLNFTYPELEADVGDMRDFLASCGVPSEEIVGWRSPDFNVNDELGQVLTDLGFLYDSSIPDAEFTQRAGPANEGMTLRCRLPRTCDWGDLPLWEVPTYRLPPEQGKRTDPQPMEGLSIFQRLEADFNRKRGMGIPTSIITHSEYLEQSANRDEIIKFIDWALAQGNTWAVTYRQLIDYYQRGGNVTMEEVMADYTCNNL